MLIEIGISFATWLGGKIADKGFDAIYEKLTAKDEIDAKFKQCVESVANKFEKKYPDILGNSIAYFFTQEDVFEELIKLLFVNQKVNAEIIAQSFDTTTLPKDFILDFITELKKQLEQELVFQELLANKELYITLTGISSNVVEIERNSTLTVEEITAIRKLLQQQFERKFNKNTFIAAYKKNLINNIKTINFIGLGVDPSIKKGKHKELDSIFVKPILQINSKFHIQIEEKKKKDISVFDLEDPKFVLFKQLFDRDYNYVVLGNAGAGKSLFLKAIMLYISEQRAYQFDNAEILSYLPFRIELKNYIAFKKRGDKGCSIIKYLIHSLESEYSSIIVEDNLQEILNKEKVVLFFDGLDEIFNIQDKIDVKNDIENFHNNFKNIKSITTSRFSGYNEAKFDEKKFCELNILAFNEDQINEYVRKWYQLEEEDAKLREDEISDFAANMHNIDKELISNPLLLSLIVILYRNNLKIPESKLEIYQSCTNTLVDKWDAQKQLTIEGIEKGILQKKEAILSDLAFWQYEELSSPNPEITYQKAKTKVAESLVKKELADEDNSDGLAESFLVYAQKRSIYFDNNFTHKTFLEYYTAYWIYSNVEKKHIVVERNRIIKKYIKNTFWYVVLELLFNLIDKDQPDTEILDKIIEENSNDTASLSFLLYVLPSLKNVSERTQMLVYSKTIEQILILKANEPKKNENKGRVKNNLFNKMCSNVQIAKQKDIINEAFNIFPDNSLNFYVLMEEMDVLNNRTFIFDNKRETNEYKDCAESNPYMFKLSRNTNASDYLDEILKYIELFGVDICFTEQPLWFGNGRFISVIERYFNNQISPQNINSIYDNLSTLENNHLTRKQILKWLFKNNSLWIYRGLKTESMNYLFDTINSANELDKLIVFIVLKNQLKYHFRMHNDLKIPPQIENIINEIRNKNNKEALKILIKELNITDKEILTL